MADAVYQTNQGNKTLAQIRQEIVNASGGMPQWQTASDADVLAKYGELTGGTVQRVATSESPLVTDNTVYQLADGTYKTVAEMRNEVVNASSGMDMWKGATADSILSKYAELSQTNPSYLTVSLPYQVNPGVWDSLSETAKNVILGAAEAGQTSSGTWTSDDYEAQIDATRPKGTAPTKNAFDWGGNKRNALTSYF